MEDIVPGFTGFLYHIPMVVLVMSNSFLNLLKVRIGCVI